MKGDNLIKWFESVMKDAFVRQLKKIEGNEYEDKLLSGGDISGMYKFMASEYTGIGGQCVNVQMANEYKRCALLYASRLAEDNERLRNMLGRFIEVVKDSDVLLEYLESRGVGDE